MKRPRDDNSRGDGPTDASNRVDARSPLPQGAIPGVSSSSAATHYELLSIPTNATLAQIEKGYRLQALKKHPDRLIPQLVTSSGNGSVDDEIEKIRSEFQMVQKAYEELKDDRKRAEYDGRLGLNLASRAMAAVLGRRAGAPDASGGSTNGVEAPARSRPSPQPASGAGTSSDDDGEEYMPATVRIVRRASTEAPLKASASREGRSVSSRDREDDGSEGAGMDMEHNLDEESFPPKFWELFVERPDLKSQWGLDVRNDSLIIEGLTGNAKAQLVPLRQVMLDSESSGGSHPVRYRIISCNGRPVSTIKEFCDCTCGTRQLLLGLSRVAPLAPVMSDAKGSHEPQGREGSVADGERGPPPPPSAATQGESESAASSDSD